MTDLILSPSAAKLTVFLGVLRSGRVATLYVVTKAPGVVVPAALLEQDHVLLEYSLSFPVPIDAIFVSEVGVEAALSFGRTLESTVVPWTAVIAIAIDRGAPMVLGALEGIAGVRGVRVLDPVAVETPDPSAGEAPDARGRPAAKKSNPFRLVKGEGSS